MNWVQRSFDLKGLDAVKSRSPSIDSPNKLPGVFGEIKVMTRSLDYSKGRNNHLLNGSLHDSKTSNTADVRKIEGSAISKDHSWRPNASVETLENNTFLFQERRSQENLKKR